MIGSFKISAAIVLTSSELVVAFSIGLGYIICSLTESPMYKAETLGIVYSSENNVIDRFDGNNSHVLGITVDVGSFATPATLTRGKRQNRA
jgi:hypothetical protein